MDREAQRAMRLGAKRMMRKRFRSRRGALPAAARAQRSAAICQRLLTLEPLVSAEAVALFWPILTKAEVNLRELDGALRQRGVELAYPAIDDEGMCFRRVEDPNDLRERGHGFAEPATEALELTALDVVVVPGLAFDEAGGRLGYGAGYYDRTLPRYRPPAVAVAAAFDLQLALDLPCDAHDVRMDWIVTDARVLRVAAG